jgi:phosphatidate cytidylyltransferase
VVVALAGIPAVLAVVFFAGRGLFGAIVLGLALVALHEYLGLCGAEPQVAWAVLACAVPIATAVPAGAVAAAAGPALLALSLVALWRVGDPAQRFRGLAEGAFGLAYIGYGLSCLWLLRERTTHGTAWVFLVLAATWAGDSAAYFIGTRFGKRRFAPLLSPKKTWEGAAGGLAGSVAGALAALPLFAGSITPGLAAAAGVAVGAGGQLGDLFESLWKRAKGVKDSGRLIPGHGGILDRIDSLLIGFPVGLHIVRAWGP